MVEITFLRPCLRGQEIVIVFVKNFFDLIIKKGRCFHGLVRQPTDEEKLSGVEITFLHPKNEDKKSLSSG